MHHGLVLALRRIGLDPDLDIVLEFGDSGSRAIPALSGSLLDWLCEGLPESPEDLEIGEWIEHGIEHESRERGLCELNPMHRVYIEHGVHCIAPIVCTHCSHRVHPSCVPIVLTVRIALLPLSSMHLIAIIA